MGNSDKYFDDSHEFRPERWLKSCGKAYHPYASLPFGHGRRMCLGKRFADLEIQTVIAKVRILITDSNCIVIFSVKLYKNFDTISGQNTLFQSDSQYWSSLDNEL